MGRLIYSLNVSLDGYIETPDHSLAWANVDAELHGWFNEMPRQVEASLYGRRMYELMAAYWPGAGDDPASAEVERDFARIWLATPKIVFSSSLDDVAWNSRLVRGQPADELALLRREFDGDLDIGGAALAASFIRAGLIDEFRPVIHPVVLGAGTPYLPPLDEPIPLQLVDEHRFDSGVRAPTYRRIS